MRTHSNLSLIESDVSLAAMTSWQIGGMAKYFSAPKNIEELKESLAWARSQNIKWVVLGGGSNVLISDSNIDCLVISVRHLNKVTEVYKENGKLIIKAEAGVNKSELLKIYLKEKLAPALFLAGIPGTLGGGIAMNAGVAEAFVPREFVELTKEVSVLKESGEIENFEKSRLIWGYRHCNGWQPGIILSATLEWPIEPNDQILDQVRQANKVRFQKQPLEFPSCGSVFVNPKDGKAAQLIDSSGLKGYSVGGAMVSLKHANFIVNTGGAKASDVKAVIEHVKKTVLEKKGVELKTEVVFIG